MIPCLRMQKTLVQALQYPLIQLQQKTLLLLQLPHILPTMTRYLHTQKTQAPQQRLVPQRHLTLAVLPQHQEVLKNQEIQQRHLTRKHRITHTLILKLVTVDVLEHVYKKYNIYVNITIWQIHHEEQII